MLLRLCIPNTGWIRNVMQHFVKHLQIIKTTFCLGKTNKVDDKNMMVGELLNANDLDCQQGMFKLTMKSNATTCMATPFDLNPLTEMWCLVTTFQILSFSFLEYVKLTKLAMVQIVGNVEDEKCFSTWTLE